MENINYKQKDKDIYNNFCTIKYGNQNMTF